MNFLHNSPFPGWIRLALCLAFGSVAVEQANAQIFVSDATDGTILEYSISGVLMNSSLVSGLDSPERLALSGDDLYVAGFGNNKIGIYTTSGATVKTSLVSGLKGPIDLALSGNSLYITDVNLPSSTKIREYNATTGAAINASLVTGLPIQATTIIVSSNNLYMVNYSKTTLTLYNATTGAVVNSSFITGLDGPEGMALSGNNLFIASNNAGTINEYNATTGALIQASLITGLSNPQVLTISGNDLYVMQSNGTIGEYTTAGATVNASLITGITNPSGMAVLAATPEPSTWAFLFLGFTALVLGARRFKAVR